MKIPWIFLKMEKNLLSKKFLKDKRKHPFQRYLKMLDTNDR